jgi:hypothetical protein
MIVWQLNSQLHVQSVPITIKVVSSNPAHGEGLWFSMGKSVSSTNKIDRHDITEILLKVVLNTITLSLLNHTLQKLHMIYLYLILPTQFTLGLKKILNCFIYLSYYICIISK